MMMSSHLRPIVGLYGFALALCFGLLLLWPTVAVPQQQRVPVIGCLLDRSGPNAFDEAFERGLREHGYIVGTNIALEYRFTDGYGERLPALAADLVARNVDIIVTQGAASTLAAKRATTTIPIVMASSQDAVGDGLVASLARPGGNVTGQSVYAPEATPKRLEILKEMVPGLTRVGLLWNARNPGGRAQFQEAERAAKSLGLAITTLEVRIPDELESAMNRASSEGAGAILILSDSSTLSHRAQIAKAANEQKLPTMFANKDYLLGNGLASYGPDLRRSFQLAARHIDKILHGAKPGDLPVEQPTHFELAVNLKAAKILGLTIPPALLARADEVIE
jgi:putative tryptophan/tyrosine transport system substrate-binding protein